MDYLGPPPDLPTVAGALALRKRLVGEPAAAARGLKSQYTRRETYMQLQDALRGYLRQLEADGRSPHTRAQYARHLGLLARWLTASGHSGEIEHVGHEDLARFLVAPGARQREDGVPKRASSTNCLRSSLRTFFAWQHAAGNLRENPARLVRRAICSPGPPRALSEVERKALLDTLAAGEGWTARRDHALFTLMLGTGMRLGATLALDVEDLDLERGELAARHMKGGRSERVLVPRHVSEHLRGWLGARVNGSVFRGRGGDRLGARQVARRLDHWMERAGIRRAASPHALRHTFAMDLLGRTHDLVLTQAALHHRSIASTLRYVGADEGRLRAALEA